MKVLEPNNVKCLVLWSLQLPRAHEKEHVTEWAKNHGKNCEESYK